ncbi:MAG: SBBP repeat-containing protein [Bacteroidetes bacterium]|nr:SBBP repeat-containing protein [Bacteroidota bacterium]
MSNSIRLIFSFLSALLLFSNENSCAQSVDFLWAKTAPGPESLDFAKSVCTDSQGNIVVAGFFTDTIIFDTDTLINHSTQWDAFLVKYDPLGNVLWARGAGGSEHDWAESVCVDSLDNIYITGSFQSPQAFFENDTLQNVGTWIYADFFLAKYSAGGDLLWAKSAGSNSIEAGLCVTSDGIGGVYVSGEFAGSTLIFDGDTLFNYGDRDVFVAKYDSIGNVLWARSAGSFSEDRGLGIDCDISGNVYVTGWMDGVTADFGDTAFACSVDFFLAKYDTQGSFVWVRSAGGTQDDRGESVCVDPNGNILVTGLFQSPQVVFGNDTIINSSFARDALVVKYDSLGNVIWARGLGGPGMDYGESVTSDLFGNVYVTGPFGSASLVFGTNFLTNINPGSDDCFIVKFDPSGAPIWAGSAGGPSYDNSYSVTTDSQGNVVICGLFSDSTFQVGSIPLVGQASSYNIFVAKMDKSTMVNEPSHYPNKVAFYPNPFSNNAILEIKDYKNDNSVLYLFDIAGREIFKKQITNSKTEIQKGNLSPGMYFYKVLSQRNLIDSGKIIIQ